MAHPLPHFSVYSKNLYMELFTSGTATEADGAKTIELVIDEATFEALFSNAITEIV